MLFKRGDFKAVAGQATEEVLWLLGPEAVTVFDELTPRTPEATSTGFPDAGYYVMRGGWSAIDPVLVFDCGPLGFGPAGHGHADALSFQLHAGGYPFFVDSGTFSYNIDYRWRDLFRGHSRPQHGRGGWRRSIDAGRPHVVENCGNVLPPRVVHDALV